MPVPLDDRIGCMCELYRHNSELRTSLVRELDTVACSALLTFGVRSAMLSVRRHEEWRLAQGITADVMVLDTGLLDARDVLVDLSVIFHSAVTLGIQTELFEDAARVALTDEAKKIVLGCLRWPASPSLLKSMGVRDIEGPGGIVYAFYNQPIPPGHLQP